MRGIRVDRFTAVMPDLGTNFEANIEQLAAIKDKLELLATNIDDIKNFNNADLSDVKEVEKIKDAITSIAQKIASIQAVATNLQIVSKVGEKISVITDVHKSIDDIANAKESMNIALCRMHDFYNRTKLEVYNAEKYFYKDLKAYHEKLVEFDKRLTADLLRTTEQIAQGHELAIKFLTYQHVVVPKEMSYECGTFYEIDEEHKVIKFYIPKAICATNVQLSISDVAPIVDAYMKQHDCCTGGNSLTNEYKKIIDANTQIAQNTGTANKIVLHNDLWDAVNMFDNSMYPDKEQIYFMFARAANTGSVTMKVGNRPEFPVLKDGHAELVAGDIQENKMYMFKLCSQASGCGGMSYHWHLIPISGGESPAQPAVTVDDLEKIILNEVVVNEDFTKVSLDNWVLLGSPKGYIKDGALVVNGDSMWHSGVECKTELDANKKYTMEFKVKQPLHGDDPYRYISVGMADRIFEDIDNFDGIANVFGFYIDGGRGNWNDRTGLYAITTTYQDPPIIDRNTGEEYIFKIEMKDNNILYYINNKLVDTKSYKKPDSNKLYFGAFGRGNDSYIKDIKIWRNS